MFPVLGRTPRCTPRRRPRVLSPVLLCLLLLCVPLAGCGSGSGSPSGSGSGAPSASADPVERDVRRAVADWSAAPPAALAAIPLEGWSYEVSTVRVDGVRALARAELRYRLTGYDTAPAGSAREVELTRDGGSWAVTADRPAPGALPQLWDQGPVSVERGAHALVLGGAGQGSGPLSEIAAEADKAVPAASAAWPRPWAGRVVVLVPGSLDAMAALLGRPAEEYRGLGAVTTGRTGAGPAPADRVVVNPEGYGQLTAEGRQVILTHETTHVATRAATTSRTPLWLSEGFADWAAYRDSGRTPAEAAPSLARAVRRGELPASLPEPGAFAFGGDADALARAYEGSWLACRLIARRWGEPALVSLYESAGRESLPTALQKSLGTDPAALTRAWQQSLTGEFR
ncbi:DUF4412 domain-containing protein [Streptomyces sp. TBY4]|uniref:DUF4412 domain-containing protein n=1 Tax=Streptomyces sp. TBY4 TaxID=2962030 RepID=UPI0020B8397E|nr:DUF4412 domain-containing protein [Streptomyces sp. TBY4]MCP3756440.1 DUF4412 domain-containing protein [Streptomyces sp. TBY4]